MRFCLVAGHKALFSEQHQALFALDDVAAYVWCRLEERASPQTVAGELVLRGLSSGDAEAAVLGLAQTWIERSLVRFAAAAKHFPPPQHSIAVAVAGLRARISWSHEALAPLIRPYLAHLEKAGPSDVAFDLHSRGDLVHLFRDRRHVTLVHTRQALPVLQRYLTEALLERLGSSFALHAATLVKDGRAMLVHGRPGAGKTTLTLALEAASFRFGGDDIAILDNDGRVRGVAFAAAVKAGSWPIIASLRPEISDNHVHQRPDGRKVRYLPPLRPAQDKSYPVKAIVFLDRRGTGSPTLREFERLTAISRIIGNAYSPDHMMSAPRLTALVSCVSQARVYELSYARLGKAAQLLERMWDA